MTPEACPSAQSARRSHLTGTPRFSFEDFCHPEFGARITRMPVPGHLPSPILLQLSAPSRL